MKNLLPLLASLALLGRQALAAWEITPLVPDANIATFNIANFDTSVWQAIHIDLLSSESSESDHHSHGSATPTLLNANGDDCYADGNNTAFCVITQDQTQCNLAVRIPSIPVR